MPVQTMIKLMLAALLAVGAARPALSCLTPTPEWSQIDRALQRVQLADADLARFKALRAQAFAALSDASKVDSRFGHEKRREAEQAKRQAMAILGFVLVTPPGMLKSRGCGGTYQLGT